MVGSGVEETKWVGSGHRRHGSTGLFVIIDYVFLLIFFGFLLFFLIKIPSSF
ncbi:hypothetical protein QJS10_CPB21g00697 [Acorus calamus]|uniref:Transmembrane protein n=1 Tax=Acorus calamus TaxID=4465 RepID=A0AAV9C6I4_ACOCL|nr:hypothetical protein QJS10_CPB21g00697 [Acorus calamus]